MDRRRFLARAGGVVALGLAGCGGRPDPDAPGSPGGSPGAGGSGPTPTPAITDRSIRTVSTGCDDGSTGRARVARDRSNATVTVSGVLRTNTPCHEAVLNAARYDRDAGELAVDVGATETEGPCIECVGAVAYEATITLAGPGPDTVVVTHDGRAVTGP